MLKVFSSTDKIFSSNGDAVINGARAIVHKEDNGDYSVNLDCSLDYIDYVKSKNILVAPTPTGYQGFRIENVETTRTKIKALCKHLYYDSDNYLIADSYVVDKNCNDALDHLNNATDTPSPFTTLSDIMSINSYRCVRKSLNEAITTVIERWGGHLVRDNYNIQVRETIGADNGVTIQYKKNLKEISVTYDWSNVCTKLLPVGKDGFLLDSLYVYSEIQYDLPYTKTVSFEQDIDAADYPTEAAYMEALRDDLTAQAVKYLESSQYPSVTYTLSANMDKITDIGDTVVVYDERLGVNITTHVIAYDYDAVLGEYTSITFGTVTKGLSNLLTSVSQEINKEVVISSQAMRVTLNNALAESEAKILGVLGNSYVIYDGDKILVVDSLPADTANNCIRINSEGIGFSQTGINGHFTSAWEINGTLNMQAINVIGLTADLIKGGTLKLGSALNQSGILEVYDEQNALIATLNKDGLKMFGVDGSYILINAAEGFVGYDRDDNKIFWVSDDEFYMRKSVITQEITLCNKLRFIPIEIRDNNNTLINDGIGLVSVYI